MKLLGLMIAAVAAHNRVHTVGDAYWADPRASRWTRYTDACRAWVDAGSAVWAEWHRLEDARTPFVAEEAVA